MVADQSWAIVWKGLPPGWALVNPGLPPEELLVTVRMARTEDGLAAEAVLVERIDGRAITTADLRKVRLPPAWALASSAKLLLQPGEDSPVITPARRGARGKGDDHWRRVFDLWSEAQRVAPRAHVKWMLTQWPDVADATMRRWISKARERADINGWRDDHA